MTKVQEKKGVKSDSAEAKRWLIIGAYEAGASEKHIARISGLSKTAVRNIVLNYKCTGIPCLPKRIPNKIRQKLIVEYDENGEIIITDDEENEDAKKSDESIKPVLTTKKSIDYAMDQMRISDISSNDEASLRRRRRRRMPPPSKHDQNIRGYEIWTHEDDMILLNHVLHHLHVGGWTELEVKFSGRHSARLCYDRWKYLKSLLLKGITDKPNTPW
ncbi:MAG: hypothetical protein EXX96DRAFT_566281 [Benjaminiella poitrasii]|nr:MAG: hypothetical protein EXX96DRAFT_566281 [Benjaminiella poitrasii]